MTILEAEFGTVAAPRSRTLTARITGINAGQRSFRVRTFERVRQIELGFIPAADERPAQARIWHEVWDHSLRRYDTHVALICQDLDLDLTGLRVVRDEADL